MGAKAPQVLRKCILEIVLVILCIVLSVLSPYFLTVENFLNILRNQSMQGIIAAGMTLLIIAGEIDLSVGSVVAFSGCLAAWIVMSLSGSAHDLGMPLNIAVAAIASLAAGFCIGMFTGWVRVNFRVPTFIITLAWLTILRGFSLLITKGFPLVPFPGWYNFFGGGYILDDIPFPAVILVIVFVITYFVANYTAFGRAIYAVGGNREAARLSGIRVNRVTIAVITIVAMLAAFSGLLQSSQIMSGSPNTATGWELDVIASVIIGGTSMAGGIGAIWGTFVGILFLGVVVNGMTLLGVDEYWQFVVRGALILAAVLINMAPAGKK